MTRTHAALLTGLLLGLLVLSGCSGLSASGDKGYVSGDGQVTTYDEAERGDPVTVTGKDLDGRPVDVSDHLGKVVVLPVWASWCAPCRAEAPDLVAATKETTGDAVFVGIDSRDTSTENAQAFVRGNEIPYASIYDPDGRILLDFPRGLGPNSIPSFAILDRQGRLAATINGELPSKLTLVELVRDVGKK